MTIEDVLTRVRNGQVRPQEAEVWAAQRGLKLAGRPDPAIFDPMSQPNWTPLQTAAWIPGRSIEKVRDASVEFRRHWRDWKEIGPFVGLGWDLVSVPPASFVELFLWEPYRALNEFQRAAETGIKHRMFLDRVLSDLVKGLESGDIVATGLENSSGERVVIPASEWSELTFDTHAADRAHSEWLAKKYKGLLLPREKILEKWPARGPRHDITLHSVLREAANRSGGTLTQNRAVEIARECGVFSSRDGVRKALKALGISGKQGRTKKTP